LTDDITAAEAETKRLQALIVQVRQFETRKAQLQERVTLIETLRKGQSSPVHVLDAVSRSVPDMLWLTQLEQKGQDLTIEGPLHEHDLDLGLSSTTWGGPAGSRSPWRSSTASWTRARPANTGLIKFTVKAQVVSPAG